MQSLSLLTHTTLLQFSFFSLLCILLASSAEPRRQRVLVYTKTTRFRHDSIPNSIIAVADLGNTTSPGWDTIATEDEKLAFGSRSALYQFDALIFISTTGDVLSPDGIEMMRQYLRDGGSFVGIHSSSDCLRSTPWFGRTLGAYFRVHPEVTNATLQVADSKHPSVSFLKNGTWAVYDEIYTFNSDPRLLNHTVLLTVEDGTYADAATSEGLRAQLMGQPHPLAWCKDGSKPGNGLMDPPSRPVGGGVDDSTNSAQPSGQGGPGRSWYTSLGHFPETYSDPLFRQHLTGGIQWVLESDSLRRRSNNSSSPGQPVADSGSDEPGTGSSLPEVDTATPSSSPSGAKCLSNPVQLEIIVILVVTMIGLLLY